LIHFTAQISGKDTSLSTNRTKLTRTTAESSNIRHPGSPREHYLETMRATKFLLSNY